MLAAQMFDYQFDDYALLWAIIAWVYVMIISHLASYQIWSADQKRIRELKADNALLLKEKSILITVLAGGFHPSANLTAEDAGRVHKETQEFLDIQVAKLDKMRK